jgi:uncharacterized OB-fold protein
MNCSRCGKVLTTTSVANGMCSDCNNISEAVDLAKQLGAARGWLCPKCGAILSPYQNYCTFCVPGFKVSYTSQITDAPFDEYGVSL